MALGPITVSHVESFDVFNSFDGLNIATREKFNSLSIVAQVQLIEMNRIKNSMIVSGEATGGMYPSFKSSSVGLSNPAGSYRTMLVPKTFSTHDVERIATLGDVVLSTYITSMIQLNIDKYWQTNNIMIDQTSMAGGWLASDVTTAVTRQLTNDITSRVNYDSYGLFAPAALNTITSFEGKAPHVQSLEGEDPTQISDDIITRITHYEALPDDKYTFGFNLNELVMAVTPTIKANLLKAKLQIFEGSYFGIEGVFYQNLPYDGIYAGVAYYTSKFMKAPNQSTDDALKFLITPIGQYAPLLFHIPENGLEAFAEIVPMQRNSVGIYSSVLWGASIAPELSQYITVGLNNPTLPVNYLDYNWKEVIVADISSSDFIVKGKAYGKAADATKSIVYQLHKATKPNLTANSAWVPLPGVTLADGLDSNGDTDLTAFTSTAISTDSDGDSVASKTQYRLTIAMSTSATGSGILENGDFTFKTDLYIWTL